MTIISQLSQYSIEKYWTKTIFTLSVLSIFQKGPHVKPNFLEKKFLLRITQHEISFQMSYNSLRSGTACFQISYKLVEVFAKWLFVVNDGFGSVKVTSTKQWSTITITMSHSLSVIYKDGDYQSVCRKKESIFAIVIQCKLNRKIIFKDFKAIHRILRIGIAFEQLRISEIVVSELLSLCHRHFQS